MRITPGRVHDENTIVCADSLGKRLRALLKDDLAPPLLTREGSIEWGTIGGFAVHKLGDDHFVRETRLAL